MLDFLQGMLLSLGRKYVMAATGFLLGVFLVIHAAGNSFVFRGKAALNAYAEQLHSSGGPLIPSAEIFLLIIFLTHILLGISLILKNREATGSRYAVKNSAGRATWGSRTMPWTGLFLLIFLPLHLGNVRFIDHSLPIADVVEQTLAHPLSTLFYLVAITALTLHTSHGFRSLLQSWGVNHSRYNGLIRGGACFSAALICAVFFGVVAVFW